MLKRHRFTHAYYEVYVLLAVCSMKNGVLVLLNTITVGNSKDNDEQKNRWKEKENKKKKWDIKCWKNHKGC